MTRIGLAAALLLFAPQAAPRERYSLDGADVLIHQETDGVRRIPPTIALAMKYGLKLRVEDQTGKELALTDENKPTLHGPTMTAEGTGPFRIRAPLVKYIFELATFPPAAPADAGVLEELFRRVSEFVASGHQGPVPREYGYTSGLVFWFEGETVSALAQSLPYLPKGLQEKTREYLAREVDEFLLNEKNLAFERQGKSGIVEWGNNTAATGQALAAFYDYCRFTGDLARAERFYQQAGKEFTTYAAIDWNYGCNPKGRVHVARGVAVSDLHAQIAAAIGMARLAHMLGDAGYEALFAGKAARLLITRYAYGVYVRPYLYENKLTEVPSRKPRGTPIDTLPAKDRYPIDAWPYDAPQTTIWPREMRFLPDGSNDPRVVVEPRDGKTYRIGMTPTGANLKSMVLHYPMTPEIGRFLGDTLRTRTQEIFDAFQANMPWWHWSDYETIIERGDETVASPDLSFSMYQTLAWALGGDAKELSKRLPWEYLNVGFRDRYRLINLGTLLRCRNGAAWEAVK